MILLALSPSSHISPFEGNMDGVKTFSNVITARWGLCGDKYGLYIRYSCISYMGKDLNKAKLTCSIICKVITIKAKLTCNIICKVITIKPYF